MRLRRFFTRCTWGFHDWRYGLFGDAAGISDYRECKRCGRWRWLMPGASDGKREE